MLISIFENYRGVAYFIDSDNFLIYRRLKKGELKIVNPNKSKYGYIVSLSMFYDDDIKRLRKKNVYLHNIIAEYIYHYNGDYVVLYNDGNNLNISKNNLNISYLDNICKKWVEYKNDSNYLISSKGDVYDKSTKMLKSFYEDIMGYIILSINGKQFRRNNLVWMHFGNSSIKDGYVIDHIDNNPNNDDINNLQLITVRENNIKDKNRKNNLPTGVRLLHGKYRCFINFKHNGVSYENILLGVFDDKDSASLCYQRASELIKNGINPIKIGNNTNIKYDFSQDSWYYIHKNKRIIGFSSYEEAEFSYNNTKSNNVINDICIRGYFSVKGNKIKKYKYGDKKFIEYYSLYNEYKDKNRLDEFIPLIPKIQEEILSEHCSHLNSSSKKKTNINYNGSKFVKNEIETYHKLDEFVNSPNFIKNSYNDCYTIRVPYVDGKYYYLHSFKSIELVNEIDSKMNEKKFSNDFPIWFSSFKETELKRYIELDNLYRSKTINEKNNRLGYHYKPKKDLFYARKTYKSKEYSLGYFADERCCQYILEECNLSIKMNVFENWYNDIEEHRMRIRKLFDDKSLYRNKTISLKINK